jgi:hypothetical protein
MSLQKYLQEALTSNQIKTLDSYGVNVVEQQSVGNYDIALLRSPFHLIHFDSAYILLFQREGLDATDHGQQMITVPPSDFSVSELVKVLKIIRGWIPKYGSIIIQSANPRNMRIYKKALERFDIPHEHIRKQGIETLILTED